MISIGNPCNPYVLMKDTEYKKKQGTSYKLKLRRCNWTKDKLKEFIKVFDDFHTKDGFNNSLYNIIDYGLHYNEVKELNFDSPESYHEIGLKNFFNGKIKNEPQNLVDLIKSLEKMNKDLKNNAITEDLLKELKNSYKIDEETKRIANDNKQEKELIIKYVKDWAKKAKEQKSKNINEIIVHINLLFGVIFKYHLRPTQIISVLVLLKRNDIKLGRIAQILTGEGKTAIIITLAATNVILGHNVDIVTSSELLAKRDAIDERNKELYNSLGITVDHCIKDGNNKQDHGPKECYNADIVYGDTHNFQADILSDKYMLENTRNGRKYDMIIVDEIDSMFVDDYGKSTLLAGEKPYMKRLNYILIGMWVKLSVSVRGETKNTIRYNIKEIESELTKVGLNILNNKSLKLPKYLHYFAEHQMENWAHSAVEATLMEENVKYRVNDKAN
jgi:preprotein translocase subunit SecA